MNRTTVVPVGPHTGAAVSLNANIHHQTSHDVSEVRCQRSSSTPAIELTRRVDTPAPGLGQILLGDGRDKITLDEVLGAGGMGVVYAGSHRVLSRQVVVKVIRSEYAHIPELVARFQREAEILAAIDSPGVVQLLDCDVTTSGLPYIVLERLEGHDLAELLETRGKLMPNEALSLILEATNALAPIHARGIIHRDIKPDNIFLHTNSNGTRQVKLLDFGVAIATNSKEHLTQPGTTMGSLHYMSPEQLRDCHTVTPASDVWSLGVVLFQLLSGELPFRAQSEAEFSAAVLTQSALNLRAVAPAINKDLAKLVARCLHKDPWKRYASAAELAKALGSYMSQRSKLRIPNPLASVRPKARQHNHNTVRTKAAVPRLRRWTKRHIAAAGVAAGLALGHFMPRDMRDELSTATIGVFAAPIQLVTGSH